MTTEQRLQAIETKQASAEEELETVRQLLISAASYAESSHERLDRLTEKMDRYAEERQQRDREIDERLDRLDTRVSEVIFHAERLIGNWSRYSQQNNHRIERLEQILANQERMMARQQEEYQEFRRTTTAALERIDRILDYLMRRDRDE